MSAEPLLEIIEDLALPDPFAEACKLSRASGWSYGSGSHDGDWGRFWYLPLAGIAVFDAIWQGAKEQCERLVGGELQVLRQYANGHTYGLGGKPHLDDTQAGSYTLLYYPMDAWPMEWEGETVFYDEHGEVALSVRPKPNRAILFDSRILHQGRAPSRQCPALRVTVAYKLRRVHQVQPSRPEPDDVPEVFQQLRLVRVPAEKVRALVDEYLLKLGESVRLPGFRPGKIPLPVLEQRYGPQAWNAAIEKLTTEEAARLGAENLVSAVEVGGDKDSGMELRMTVLHLPSMPLPDLSQVTVERLTADGVTPEALEEHWKEQLLNTLDQQYTFAVPAQALQREHAAILEAAQSLGPVSQSDATELQAIAERRLRLGLVIAELARRSGIPRVDVPGPEVESVVLAGLLEQCQVNERPATEEELRELAD